jgi:hypothetical protein
MKVELEFDSPGTRGRTVGVKAGVRVSNDFTATVEFGLDGEDFYVRGMTDEEQYFPQGSLTEALHFFAEKVGVIEEI